MILLEEGRIRLTDRVATYFPGFERYGKSGQD
jgi:CubicO group peptidase (beta-lactamase class C family)